MRLRVWSVALVSLAFPTLPAFTGTAEQSQLLQAQRLSNQGELAQVVRVLELLVHSEPNALDDDSRAALVLVGQTGGRNTPLDAAAELSYARLLRAPGPNAEATQKEPEARAALDGIRRRQCNGYSISAASLR